MSFLLKVFLIHGILQGKILVRRRSRKVGGGVDASTPAHMILRKTESGVDVTKDTGFSPMEGHAEVKKKKEKTFIKILIF